MRSRACEDFLARAHTHIHTQARERTYDPLPSPLGRELRDEPPRVPASARASRPRPLPSADNDDSECELLCSLPVPRPQASMWLLRYWTTSMRQCRASGPGWCKCLGLSDLSARASQGYVARIRMRSLAENALTDEVARLLRGGGKTLSCANGRTTAWPKLKFGPTATCKKLTEHVNVDLDTCQA